MTDQDSTRREFIQHGTATTAAAAAGLAMTPQLFSIGRSGGSALETINIGVVGTGGRGSGACNDNLSINDNVRQTSEKTIVRNQSS